MQIQRKAVKAGIAVEFRFECPGSMFRVTNYTDAYMEVSFGKKDETFLIKPEEAKTLISRLEPRMEDFTNVVVVTAEIDDERGAEVQCLDY
ncbi:MAG: hypothetical protein Q4F24_08050 [Eubacteriales bacterium]|nr:hypothetical protein [Eubacteriales bacterium]